MYGNKRIDPFSGKYVHTMNVLDLRPGLSNYRGRLGGNYFENTDDYFVDMYPGRRKTKKQILEENQLLQSRQIDNLTNLMLVEKNRRRRSFGSKKKKCKKRKSATKRV
jgi:hypothetical protein